MKKDTPRLVFQINIAWAIAEIFLIKFWQYQFFS